jgi:hypothetical protein
MTYKQKVQLIYPTASVVRRLHNTRSQITYLKKAPKVGGWVDKALLPCWVSLSDTCEDSKKAWKNAWDHIQLLMLRRLES